MIYFIFNHKHFALETILNQLIYLVHG